jgi:hypothetical protein
MAIYNGDGGASFNGLQERHVIASVPHPLCAAAPLIESFFFSSSCYLLSCRNYSNVTSPKMFTGLVEEIGGMCNAK